jgi:hypothetical protein
VIEQDCSTWDNAQIILSLSTITISLQILCCNIECVNKYLSFMQVQTFCHNRISFFRL